ncbi:hypothetical protein [Fischerella thermalis]|uniref:hypothetical protein n=1 Tax=Fischerella thermalis TaxID=372787 RepID=UPI002155360D|nr:hypothetical protein [Fischerella thermalis]
MQPIKIINKWQSLHLQRWVTYSLPKPQKTDTESIALLQGVGVLLGVAITAIGIHGICILPNKTS